MDHAGPDAIGGNVEDDTGDAESDTIRLADPRLTLGGQTAGSRETDAIVVSEDDEGGETLDEQVRKAHSDTGSETSDFIELGEETGSECEGSVITGSEFDEDALDLAEDSESAIDLDSTLVNEISDVDEDPDAALVPDGWKFAVVIKRRSSQEDPDATLVSDAEFSDSAAKQAPSGRVTRASARKATAAPARKVSGKRVAVGKAKPAKPAAAAEANKPKPSRKDGRVERDKARREDLIVQLPSEDEIAYCARQPASSPIGKFRRMVLSMVDIIYDDGVAASRLITDATEGDELLRKTGWHIRFAAKFAGEAPISKDDMKARVLSSISRPIQEALGNDDPDHVANLLALIQNEFPNGEDAHYGGIYLGIGSFLNELTADVSETNAQITWSAYTGMSGRTVALRVKDHLATLIRKPKGAWHRLLKKHGCTPTFHPLAVCEDGEASLTYVFLEVIFIVILNTMPSLGTRYSRCKAPIWKIWDKLRACVPMTINGEHGNRSLPLSEGPSRLGEFTGQDEYCANPHCGVLIEEYLKRLDDKPYCNACYLHRRKRRSDRPLSQVQRYTAKQTAKAERAIEDRDHCSHCGNHLLSNGTRWRRTWRGKQLLCESCKNYMDRHNGEERPMNLIQQCQDMQEADEVEWHCFTCQRRIYLCGQAPTHAERRKRVGDNWYCSGCAQHVKRTGHQRPKYAWDRPPRPEFLCQAQGCLVREDDDPDNRVTARWYKGNDHAMVACDNCWHMPKPEGQGWATFQQERPRLRRELAENAEGDGFVPEQ